MPRWRLIDWNYVEGIFALMAWVAVLILVLVIMGSLLDNPSPYHHGPPPPTPRYIGR